MSKADFRAWLDGFSPNVQDILDKFEFRNQTHIVSKPASCSPSVSWSSLARIRNRSPGQFRTSSTSRRSRQASGWADVAQADDRVVGVYAPAPFPQQVLVHLLNVPERAVPGR